MGDEGDKHRKQCESNPLSWKINRSNLRRLKGEILTTVGSDELRELGQRYLKYVFPQKVGAGMSHRVYRLNKQSEKLLSELGPPDGVRKRAKEMKIHLPS